MTPTHIRRALYSARHHKLGLNGLALLCLLHERGSVSMTTAAQELDISTAAITGQADTLCDLAFAQREHTTGDRRGIQLHITTRGHSACDTITQGLPRTQKDLPTKTLGIRYAR
jgi:DNA-binding MarR family transcriptional regulator